MPENDDFPALDEKLAERLSSLDETEALQRADTLRAGLKDYELDEEDARLLEAVA
jgi:GTPase